MRDGLFPTALPAAAKAESDNIAPSCPPPGCAPNAGTNIRSINICVSRPPPPCASVMKG